MNILIVDDQEDARIILQKALEADGHQVRMAENGVQALELLRNDRYDLIISDILMPVMDGFQLCLACKQNESLKTVPFVFYTATYTDARDEALAREIGAQRFIRKPVEQEEFKQIIHEVIRDETAGSAICQQTLRCYDEKTYKLYSERLVKKLNQKMLSLDKALREKTAAEKEAQTAEARFRVAFDNANIGICFVDPDGRLLRVNRQMSAIFGYTRQELERMTVNDIAHPEDIHLSPGFIKQAMAGAVEHTEFEKRYIHKQGHTLWGKVASSLVKDESGRPLYFISHIQDITRHKKTESALKESEYKYRTLVETANDVICVVQDGLLKFHSHRTEELLGFETTELTNAPLVRFIYPDDRDAVMERIIRRLQGEKHIATYPFRVIHKNGRVLWAEGSAALFTWEGRPAILSFLRDVTERKKLEAQLIQAQKLESVGRLAGGVAHDFNNMLSVILGYTEMLLGDLTEDHPHHDPAKEICTAGMRARNLTRQLLAFSREQVFEIKTIDLNAAVKRFEKMLRRMLREDIGLELKLASKLITIQADIAQLEQVLMNLVVNARDAMPEGGQILIETADVELDDDYCSTRQGVKPGNYAMLVLSDSGIGMDQQTQAQIFDPFFTTKDKSKGTGLGLSTAYGIVKQHGGNIWVYSEIGHGTTFKIYLPMSTAEAEPENIQADAPIARVTQATILVVEDDPSVRKLACTILKKHGYTVLDAGMPEDALDIARKQTGAIDLLLTDVIMPGMKGPEVFESIATMHPETKVLYMSGYPGKSISRHGVPLKGNELVGKPITVKELLEKVANVLAPSA